MRRVAGSLAESPSGTNPRKGRAGQPFEPPSHITSEPSPQNSRESNRNANKEIPIIPRTTTGLAEREELPSSSEEVGDV